MQELEIEKRYLISAEKLAEMKTKLSLGPAIHMNDYYIPNGDKHKDLRLRQKGDEYMITRKSPIRDGDLTIMRETTLPLSREEFTALSCGVSTNIEKDRYEVDIDGWKGELDIFSGRHAGLAILEVEFSGQSELEGFAKTTNWNLPDITNLEWLASGRLAETSFAALALKLRPLIKSL